MQTKNKKIGLGRGLGALLTDQETVQESANQPIAEKLNAVNEISVLAIETNPYQPRTHFDQQALHELSESIRVQGIIQPITVRQLGPNAYQLISGERRLQASKLAGLQSIPAYVRTADDQQMLEMALIENIQRENLNAIEIALSYQRLLHECNLKQEELGDRVGKNRTTVNNYLRLLKLPPQIQAAVRDTQITMGHARALVNIEDPQDQLDLFEKMVQEEWSVRRVEEAVRQLGQPQPQPKKKSSLDLTFWQNQLAQFLGSKVKIMANDQHKGEIKIPFKSKEELEKLIQMLHAQQ
ncbi:MAG: ParB/RepB/Spo0J family partition protein [Spirosomataceae bacterium]